MLTQSMGKFRQEDKLALRRANRFCNTGGNNPPVAFGLNSDAKGAHRPPSSNATYSSVGAPMQIRSRFQKKLPTTIIRNSHSNTNKSSSGLAKKV